MSKVDDLRDAILADLQTISGIGNVLDYWPNITNVQDFNDQFSASIDGDDIIEIWFVRFVEATPQPITHGLMTAQYTYEIHGYRGFRDLANHQANEHAFLDTSEAVYVSVFNRSNWGDSDIRNTHEPSWERDERVFGTTLCLHTLITLPIKVDIGTFTGG